MKVRELTLRILAASVMLGQEIDHDHHTNNGVADDGKKPVHTILKDLQVHLSTHVNNCQFYSQERKVSQHKFYCKIWPGLLTWQLGE